MTFPDPISPSPFPVAIADHALRHRLGQYTHFGVHLGLERIHRLLAALGNPQAQVPIVHVAGTNGKGSVCAYLSAVLTAAGYRVGRYTSPHLVSWCERICINEQAIAPAQFEACLDQVEAAIDPEAEPPTLFEIVTAIAWLHFAQQAVDIAVMEVGLGGRLDATNVVDTPLVSVITSLSREHWQRLGPTLADIAREKAGILKPHCPAVIGPLPPEADAVVTQRLRELPCPHHRPAPATALAEGWASYPPHTYRLPFAGAHQLVNSAIAIATLHTLRDQGWVIPDDAITTGIAQARWPGRLQWIPWRDDTGTPHPLLIDGAHNPAAAKVLRDYVDTQLANGATVTWLMGMLSTKDHADIFRELLRPGDRLHLVPVPDHASAEPEALGAIAQTICPSLSSCNTYTDLATGLAAAVTDTAPLTVLCGSLYLIGHFFATQAERIGGGV